MKILLIEDDHDVLSTLESIFSSFYPHSEMINIRSGEEFLRGAWKSETWNLIILDLMLPGATGFDVCQALRNHNDTKHVPIVAITGYDTLENKDRILRSGASAYIPKPFEIKDVLAVIKKYLGSASAQKSLGRSPT